MKVVELRLHAMRDGETIQGVFAIEQRRGDRWERVKFFGAESGQSPRRIWLEDDQRLVVEALPDVELVIDKEQMAATPRKREDPWLRQRRAEEAKEEREREACDQQVREAALEEAKRRMK